MLHVIQSHLEPKTFSQYLNRLLTQSMAGSRLPLPSRPPRLTDPSVVQVASMSAAKSVPSGGSGALLRFGQRTFHCCFQLTDSDPVFNRRPVNIHRCLAVENKTRFAFSGEKVSDSVNSFS